MKPAVPRAERGAALLAVLAMVVLLAGFATAGLAQLKAAGDRVTAAQAEAEAQLLASTGVNAARSLLFRMKAQARFNPAILREPLTFELPTGRVEVRFADGGNCFNLNSLARPPSQGTMDVPPPAARPQDFARLLAATGIPLQDATRLAQATAARLQQTGQLWADASEWAATPGVSARHWALAAPLLCALPSRETATLNINSLTADQAPLLAAMGVGADEARRAIATRPAAGWNAASDFLNSATSHPDQDGAIDDRLGTTTRWMALVVDVQTPAIHITRDLLLDSLQQPAAVVSSRWHVVEEAP